MDRIEMVVQEGARRLKAVYLVTRVILPKEQLLQALALYQEEFSAGQTFTSIPFSKRLAEILQLDKETRRSIQSRLNQALSLTKTQLDNYERFEDQWLSKGGIKPAKAPALTGAQPHA